MATYEHKRAQTKAQLLRAGTAVVAANGVGAASIGEISRHAGVVPGTFYNHFATREDFLNELASEFGSRVRLGAEVIRDVEGDPAGQVALGLAGLMRQAGDDAQFGAAFVELAAHVPALTERLREVAESTIAHGVKTGRFNVMPGPETTDALVGVALEAVRSRVSGRTSASAEAAVATLGLQLLGMSPKQAATTAAGAFRARARGRDRREVEAVQG